MSLCGFDQTPNRGSTTRSGSHTATTVSTAVRGVAVESSTQERDSRDEALFSSEFPLWSDLRHIHPMGFPSVPQDLYAGDDFLRSRIASDRIPDFVSSAIRMSSIGTLYSTLRGKRRRTSWTREARRWSKGYSWQLRRKGFSREAGVLSRMKSEAEIPLLVIPGQS